jgi:sugar O-acyltransferase (sialic acid O-acetyltransferase NeuD family)
VDAQIENIVVIGASGHAKVVLDVLEKAGRYRVAGLIDSFKEPGALCGGYSVLGAEPELAEMARRGEVDGAIVAVGDNWVRHMVAQRILDMLPGFPFVTAVHPSAQLGRNVCIGKGSVVMAGAVINSDSRVGEGCIVNTNASLDHDCAMGDFSCLLPGAIVGGDVRIGRFSVLALGARVIHGVTIGEHVVVGAGATVLANLPDRAVAWGTPAKVVRSRQPGEKYLSR